MKIIRWTGPSLVHADVEEEILLHKYSYSCWDDDEVVQGAIASDLGGLHWSDTRDPIQLPCT